VELYNGNDQPVSLAGWQIDDDEGGSIPYALPPGTVIAARGFLLFFGNITHLNFGNTRDRVRLLHADGTVHEEFAYATAYADRSYSKTVDGGTEWTVLYSPSPGRPNGQ